MGPLLFSIYINDLPLFLSDASIDLYADDSTIYTAGQTINDIESTLNSQLKVFEQWCYQNKLIINTKKTKAMLIYTRQRRLALHHPKLSIKVTNGVIDCVDKHKILGLTIDHHLSWEHHISILCNKLSSLIGLLWRVRNYLTFEMKCIYYNSFVLS